MKNKIKMKKKFIFSEIDFLIRERNISSNCTKAWNVKADLAKRNLKSYEKNTFMKMQK